MKKYYFLIIVALILGLVLTGCSLLSNISQVPATDQSGITYLTKHTVDAPQVTALLAGQTIGVGTVSVWNDDVYLYVKYETTGPWVMTETHLAVVKEIGHFPTNKPGNPKVGHFPYGEENIFTNIWEQTIKLEDLEAIADQQLYIAAHAVVVDTNSTQIVSIVSNEGDTVYGPLYTATPIGSGDWEPSKEATEAINNITDSQWQWGLDPPRTGVDIPDALWISTASYTEDEGLAYSWRWFTEGLEVPKYPVPNSGILIINANNEYWAYLNGTFVGTDNWSFPPTGIETWPFDPIMGNNTFDFLVKNFPPEHPIDNPNGLTYKVTADYYDHVETAWAKGEPFTNQGNWATYFTYTVQLPQDGMVLWLDAGKGITRSGELVSEWADQSGNSNDATADAPYQPTHGESVFGLNNKPVVSFTGGEKYLRHSPILTNDYTAFYVLKLNESGLKSLYYYHAGAVNSGDLGFFAESKWWPSNGGWGSVGNYPGLGSDFRISADYPTKENWRIHTHQPNALYKNGDEVDYIRKDDVLAGGLTTIGSRSDYHTLYFVGDIAEILVYDCILTDTERKMVEAYLGAKYNL